MIVAIVFIFFLIHFQVIIMYTHNNLFTHSSVKVTVGSPIPTLFRQD